MAILDSGLHTEERSFHQAGVEDDLCIPCGCSSVSCECTILLPRVHPSIHSFVHSFIHLLFPSSLDGFIASFFRSFSFIHSLTHSVTHSLIHSSTHSLTHSFIHSFIFHSLFMTLSLSLSLALSLPALSSSMRLLSFFGPKPKHGELSVAQRGPALSKALQHGGFCSLGVVSCMSCCLRVG